jgi:uncharacterized coiled-coil protein SlyX
VASEAKSKLYHGCKDPAILGEREKIESERAKKNQAIGYANSFIAEQRSTLTLMAHEGPDKYISYDADVKKLQTAIADKNAEIDGVKTELAELDKRYAELESAMLNP